MSQSQDASLSRSGGGGGSVRRARERMEAGIPPELPRNPPQQKPYDATRTLPSQRPQKPYEAPRAVPVQQSQIPRPRPQMPQGLAGPKNGTGPIGVAISRPTQVPQWPLAGTIENVQDSKGPQYQPPAGKSNPPQRPPRPSHVPSMLDASRLQEHTPSFQYKPQTQQNSDNRGMQTRYIEDDDEPITSPMTQSSRPSTVSSVGTIPDFPVPMLPPQAAAIAGTGPRRSANLGPPPTSRRGASSYYSQASYVSPIPEESPRSQPTHDSYASSAAIPSSWGSESPTYDYDDGYYEKERGFGHDVIEEGRESRESNDNDDTGLIRSASLGKRAKPSMITTKSSDKIERPSPVAQQNPKLERMGVENRNEDVAAATWNRMNAARVNEDGKRGTVWPMIGNVDSPLAGGTGLIDKSTSSSETDLPVLTATAPPLPCNNQDINSKDMLGAYKAASSLQPGPTSPIRTPSPGFSRLSAIRRPPRLDIDAVRDAEARGSLTSLPDLIRRATRLAAMMDRGKRPGSRLALDDFPSEGDLGRDKEMELSTDEKRQSGLSGMLAAFPPPGLATPRDGQTPRPVSPWPSPGPNEPSSARGLTNQRPKKAGRRCCGLPCWAFLLLMIVLLLVIAAAVVLPLYFLVIRKNNNSTPALTPLQKCAADPATACQNGGSAFLNSGNCACICINGFTGSVCSVTGATGCTTTTLEGGFNNVTLGESVPRILEGASNFSIPLDARSILARFNTANLSCLAENALVSFSGAAKAAVPERRKRDDVTSTMSDMPKVTGGLVYDTSSTPVISRTSSTPASIAASPTSSSGSTQPTASFLPTTQTINFARVAVLFVLQQENLDAAVAAQSSLQKFFNTESSTYAGAQKVALGGANFADLINLSVNLGNGTVGGSGSTSTRKRREMNLRLR